MDFLFDIDTQLLIWINGHHYPFLDSLMWLISGKITWLVLYIGLLICVYKVLGIKMTITFIFALTLTILLSDQVCASLLRPWVARMRPSNPDNPVSQMIVLVNNYMGGRNGFPSCHAANSSALAMLISLLFKNKWISIILSAWVFLVCYSRIYLGVHYPSDIIGGVAIGVTIAAGIFYLAKQTANIIPRHEISPILILEIFASNLMILASISLFEQFTCFR